MFLDFNKDGKFNLDDLKTSVFGLPVWVLIIVVGGVTYYVAKKGRKAFKAIW
jgi:hypothetical protein